MKYEISVRVTLPEEISCVIREEKQRFETEYGSSYKSEPHVTLYLESYTKEGYTLLVEKVRSLEIKPFTFYLLSPNVRTEGDRHRSLYFIDIQNKEELRDLHDRISEIAKPYRSPFLREKIQKELETREIRTDGKRRQIDEAAYDPHITLGEISIGKPQPDIKQVQKNLTSVEGRGIMVSSISIFFYGKEDNEEKFSLIEKIDIPFKK